MAKNIAHSRSLGIKALLILCLFLGACKPEPPPPLVLSCAGDSLMRPMPYYFRQLLRPRRRKLVLLEWAQGGLNTKTYQSFFREHEEKWRRALPDAVLVQLGTNDVPLFLAGTQTVDEFEAGLTKILEDFQDCRSRDGRPPLLLVATAPFFADTPANLEKNRLVSSRLNPTIRKAARRAGAVIVDNFAVLENRPELYDPDGVHPNCLGEAALARNWARAVRSRLSGSGKNRR
ncbi:MAG: hypothetical protein A2Y56_15915 [Candidatus Aminicenantes bacterium RBG_13_63_10]|nr:MAG: hypothetical protein A2Y56_15915 [Candidatus Aminicenantes bacterium RBG_13_63_10]